MEVHAQLGDVRHVTRPWSDQARALTEQGARHEALKLRETQELPMWRAQGEDPRVVSTQRKIADLKLRLGEPEDAAAIFTSEGSPIC